MDAETAGVRYTFFVFKEESFFERRHFAYWRTDVYTKNFQ